jgi:hypothetical protein
MRAATLNLVRPFTGDHHLVTGIAHGPAQQVFGDAMCVETQRLRLQDGVGKMIRKIDNPTHSTVLLGSVFLRLAGPDVYAEERRMFLSSCCPMGTP